MKTNTRNFRTCAAAALLAGMLMAPVTIFADSPGETGQVPGAGNNWHTLEVKTEVDGKEKLRGHLLFTTDSEATGVAFRCEKGKLIALVSASPLDFRQMLELRFGGSKDWQVSFTLNGVDERTEEWVQLYRGRIFMVKKLQTTRHLFELANTQGSFEFTRKYGKPVTVILPAPEQEVFDEFLRGCQLQDKYLPTIHAASKTALVPMS